MDSQPIAYIQHSFVRILACHRNGYTCVFLRSQAIKILDSSAYDVMLLTTKLENGIEKFKYENDIHYIKDFYYHREDGPAIIYSDPKRENEFWISGKRYRDSQEYFEALTPEQKLKAIFNINELKS